jgi:acyl carrier protein
VGRPLPGAQCLVVSHGDQLLGIGETGAVVLRTPYRAHYHHDARANAAAFRPDPFGDGTCWYHTGDRGRFLAGGRLELLGRADRQIKIHGQRVEPGELEQVLRDHETVAEAAVFADLNGPAPRLIAHVVPAMHRLEPAELTAYLRTRLPAAMVPATIAVRERMPRTASGKIDRSALPLSPPSPPSSGAFARNQLERQLAHLWAEVLPQPIHADDIAIDANFFELGGHSLSLTALRAKITRYLGRRISLLDLFRFPTIRGLAAFLRAGEEPTPASSRAEARLAGRRRAARGRRLRGHGGASTRHKESP